MDKISSHEFRDLNYYRVLLLKLLTMILTIMGLVYMVLDIIIYNGASWRLTLFIAIIGFIPFILNKLNKQLIASYIFLIGETIASLYHIIASKATELALLLALIIIFSGLLTNFKFTTFLYIFIMGGLIYGIIFGPLTLYPIIDPETHIDFANSTYIVLPTITIAYLLSISLLSVLLRSFETYRNAYEMLQKAQEKLVEQEKLESIQIFAGGIAHDFNNLLMSIMGNVNLVRTFPDDIQENQKLLEEAELATNRAKNLANQLLAFSKRNQPIKKMIKLDDIIKETTIFSLRGQTIKPEFDIQENLWVVNCDRDQISQVIQNLVINGAQAIIGGGIIEIHARNCTLEKNNQEQLTDGKYIEIRIKNYGPCIPPDVQKHLFTPFFSTKKSGTGLGLVVSNIIIKNHNGKIDFTSEEGKGTEFRILLPAIGDQSIIIPEKSDNIIQTTGRVLVMDDDKDLLRLIVAMLGKMGLQADVAHSGKQIIQFLKDRTIENYQFAILDLTIQGGKGALETIEDLRVLTPTLPVILSSGYASGDIISNYKQLKFDYFLPKPYNIGELNEIVKEILKKND